MKNKVKDFNPDEVVGKIIQLEKQIKKLGYTDKIALTLEEAAEYLQLSKSRLYKMTSSKEINFYVPGGKKIYFLKDELDEWILSGKVTSIGELELETDNYLSGTTKLGML